MKAWTVAIVYLAGIPTEQSLHFKKTELEIKVNPLPHKHLILQWSH